MQAARQPINGKTDKVETEQIEYKSKRNKKLPGRQEKVRNFYPRKTMKDKRTDGEDGCDAFDGNHDDDYGDDDDEQQ